MNRKIASLTISVLLWASGISRADFKYTESAKVTGGMMAGMMKVMGAFSKEAKQASGPMQSTTYVKGNRMRIEDANGEVKIFDLDGRRIIGIDAQKHAYSVVTFDQMRAAIENAKARAQQEAQRKEPESANVKIIPKIEATPTRNTKTILNQPTKEVKVRIDMEMQSDDPKMKGQTASFWVTSDAWVAPSVPGYDEVHRFQIRLAKELDWLPGAMFGGNPQISPAMMEFRKQTADMNGFPLLQYASFGLAGTGQPAPSGAGSGMQAGQQTQSSPSSNQISTPGGAAAKAIGGVLGGFGGFGKRKKKQEPSTDQSSSGSSTSPSASGQSPQTGSSSASFMDMTAEVTSFSNSPLDDSLFEIPAGYAQVQATAEQMVRNKQR